MEIAVIDDRLWSEIWGICTRLVVACWSCQYNKIRLALACWSCQSSRLRWFLLWETFWTIPIWKGLFVLFTTTLTSSKSITSVLIEMVIKSNDGNITWWSWWSGSIEERERVKGWPQVCSLGFSVFDLVYIMFFI